MFFYLGWELAGPVMDVVPVVPVPREINRRVFVRLAAEAAPVGRGILA